MNEHGKSDRFVVPANSPNKGSAAEAAAEAGEERERAKGNTDGETRPGRSAGPGVSSGLDRVREVAVRDKEARFTALLHHVTVSRLRWAYWAISPKADGRLRPLGIAALEDKVVQRAVAEVLNAIYETDFLGFSYGFRPGRKPHDALDALAVGIERKKVKWVLDADIRDFFGQLDRGWLEKFLRHRIADERVLRLIGKWLAAGVVEEGVWSEGAGAPQGASASPLLANVYLHYVLD